MSKYEITNQQYCDFLNSVDTSESKVTEWIDTTSPYCEIKRRGDRFVVLDESKRNHPVVTISWYGAVAFCNYLSEHFDSTRCYNLKNWSYDSTANGFRLPTEAEWEFAARGGKKSKGFKYSGSGSLDLVAWYYKNSGGNGPSQVGEKQGNELGLYDMSGNVYEWCHDWYDENYYEKCNREGTVTNPKGPLTGDYRVLRGGSWHYSEGGMRCSNRSDDYPSVRDYVIGFRVVR